MYLPIVSLNRSQNIRIGSGFPDQLGRNDQEGSSKLFHAFHADLQTGNARRDLQRHSAIGSYEVVGSVTTKAADLYASTSSIVTAGSGLAVDIAAFTLASRLFTDQSALSVSAVSNLSVPGSTNGDLIYLIEVDEYGNVTAVPGGAATGTATYEVDKVTITGSPTGGTFTLSFTYNDYDYTTATIAYNASATTVASGVLAATSTDSGPALVGGMTGTGGALPGTAVTLTASGLLTGPITNQSIDVSGLTGGTPAGTFVSDTAGVASDYVSPSFDGNSLPVAWVLVPEGASSLSSADIQNIAYTS